MTYMLFILFGYCIGMFVATMIEIHFHKKRMQWLDDFESNLERYIDMQLIFRGAKIEDNILRELRGKEDKDGDD